MSQGKSWVFTINNYTDADLTWLTNIECVYVLATKEVGESGTPHLQGWISFVSNYRLNALKKLHPRAHWERMGGAEWQSSNYCKKVDSVIAIERGLAPRKGKQGAVAQLQRWKDAKDSAIAGDFDNVPADIYMRYYSTCKRLRQDRLFKLDKLEKLDNLWIWGETGTGKSLLARELAGDVFYNKNLNKWWCDYDDEEVVIIEEYHPECKLAHYMKIWADHYPFRGEYKGGSRMIRPRRVIVTSNFSPEECFSGVDLEAIRRRFKVMHKVKI